MSMPSPSPRTLRIALLLCDTPNPLVLAEEGDYLSVFRTHLLSSLASSSSLSSQDIKLDVVGFDVVSGEGEWPDEETAGEWDGVMITGSAHCSYDDVANPWVPKTLKFLRMMGERYPHVKIIGTCFGMQLLVRAFGGEVTRNPAGWEIGTYSMSLTPIGSTLLASPASSSPPPKTIAIQQMHADYAPSLPPKGDWELLASTEKCEVQGMVSFYPSSEEGGERKVRMMGWQGHPEFTQSIVDKVNTVRSASGVFTKEMSEEATRRAALPHDGTGKIGEMMIRVLLGDL